ncbi:MAG: hypothetical protein AB7C95_00980 [Synergistaceae bacterium]
MRKTIPVLVLMCLTLVLVACNEVKYADRTLKTVEALYTTAHAASNQVWEDTTIPAADRVAFKEKMLPVLGSTEGAITAGNVALQAYISAKTDDNRSALLKAITSVVGNAMKMLDTYNRTAKNIGKEEIVVPDELASAFGLLK